MTKKYYWRTQNTNARYVDSDSGDDVRGDGTMQNPYKSLGKAYRISETKPSMIICRGFFSEDMADGNHSCTIMGDYAGAAVFDGQSIYSFYGFVYTNLIIRNAAGGHVFTSVFTGSPLLAGVGRAGSSNVGSTTAFYLLGLSGSRAIVGRSAPYFGIVGGSGSRNAIFYPIHNEDYYLFPFFYNKPSYWSVVGVKKEDRCKSKNTTSLTSNGCNYSIFADVAFYISDGITFSNCYFGNDCTWWDADGVTQFFPSGETSEEKIQSLRNWIEEQGITSNSGFVFNDCVFLDKNAKEIFNDPENGDLVVKLDAGIPDGVGCLGNGISIAIRDISSDPGTTDNRSTWDITTAKGIKIEDGALKLDFEDDAEELSIETTAIELDPQKYAIDGIYSFIESHFAQCRLLYDKNVLGETYNVGDTLTAGKYVVNGRIQFDGSDYFDQDVITVFDPETAGEDPNKSPTNQFETPFDWDGESTVTELLDSNTTVAVYARSFPNILKVHEGTRVELTPGKTYIILENRSTNPAQCNGRKLFKGSIIEAGESYVITSNGNMKVGLLNDTYTQWTPQQPYGELFISKVGKVFDYDDDGEILSSGNPRTWLTPANGGYSGKMNKTIIQSRYTQLKLIAKKC